MRPPLQADAGDTVAELLRGADQGPARILAFHRLEQYSIARTQISDDAIRPVVLRLIQACHNDIAVRCGRVPIGLSLLTSGRGQSLRQLAMRRLFSPDGLNHSWMYFSLLADVVRESSIEDLEDMVERLSGVTADRREIARRIIAGGFPDVADLRATVRTNSGGALGLIAVAVLPDLPDVEKRLAVPLALRAYVSRITFDGDAERAVLYRLACVAPLDALHDWLAPVASIDNLTHDDLVEVVFRTVARRATSSGLAVSVWHDLIDIAALFPRPRSVALLAQLTELVTAIGGDRAVASVQEEIDKAFQWSAPGLESTDCGRRKDKTPDLRTSDCSTVRAPGSDRASP